MFSRLNKAASNSEVKYVCRRCYCYLVGVYKHFQLLYPLSDRFLWFVQTDRLLQNCHLHMRPDHRGCYIRVFCHDKSSYIHQFELTISQTFYPVNSLEYKLKITYFVYVLFPRMLRTDRILLWTFELKTFKRWGWERTGGLKWPLRLHRVGLWVSLSKSCQYSYMYLRSRLQGVHCYLPRERHMFVLPELSQWYWATCR